MRHNVDVCLRKTATNYLRIIIAARMIGAVVEWKRKVRVIVAFGDVQ